MADQKVNFLFLPIPYASASGGGTLSREAMSRIARLKRVFDIDLRRLGVRRSASTIPIQNSAKQRLPSPNSAVL